MNKILVGSLRDDSDGPMQVISVQLVGHFSVQFNTQVFVALCVYLLLAYLKHVHGFTHILQQMCRLIHLNLFARSGLDNLFRPPPNIPVEVPQMALAL